MGDVASGAVDGGVMVYERAANAVHLARTSHKGRVYQLHWRGEELQTGSFDGTVRIWNKRLVAKSIHSADRPIRDLELLNSGWIANVGGTRLWLHHNGIESKFETGPVISDVSVSSDSNYFGAVVGRDLIVYDLRRRAIAAIRAADAAPHCVHFVDGMTMLLCGPSGEILSASVENLRLLAFKNPKRRIRDETR